MMKPIVLEFEVEANVDQAFSVWTEHSTLWWPRSHSMSQTDSFEVIFEPFAGGRIYELGPDRTEHEWGEIVVWDPPHRVEYWWHIFLDREIATKVSISFTPSLSGTSVRLENSGFEVFGDGSAQRKERVGEVWQGITRQYREAF
jgi:uncharacterized protein YndB with AHSA1/START domain